MPALPLRLVENEDAQGAAFWRAKYDNEISDDEAEDAARNLTGFMATLIKMKKLRESRERDAATD